jgi:uncharacterized protein YggL (DUF469 family)
MSKHRSRRQSKKLHIGEFQELGFLFEATLKAGANEHTFFEAFLTEAIDLNKLGFGGWATGGSVEKHGRGSVTEEQRQMVLNWLVARPEVAALSATGLVDMWYSTKEGANLVAIEAA